MKKENLIDEIKKAFDNEKYPGDNNLVYNNSREHYECNELKNQFIGKKWFEITNELLFENKDALPFFSKEGFKYYVDDNWYKNFDEFEKAIRNKEVITNVIGLELHAKTIKTAEK